VRRAAGGAAIGALGAWYAVTAAAQFPALRRRLDRFDPSGMLLPSWRFFAPWPAVHDLDLYCRDQLADGTVTPFRDVTIVQARRLQHAVFHSNRRHEKGVFDLCQATLWLAARWPLERLQLTLPYLHLLNWVTASCAHHPDAVRTQFLIGRSAAYDSTVEPDFLFASDFHLLRVPAPDAVGP
jgi:hypothetical protein